MVQTLNSAIKWWSKSIPDAVAISFEGDAVTYREYDAWSERIAQDLLEGGLEAGDRVGICASNSIQYCALIMGIIRAGGIVSPLNMRYTTHELGEILEDTSPRWVFADGERRPKLEELPVQIKDLAEVNAFREGDPVDLDHDIDPDAPVVIISTSGSTAKPKGVLFSHRSMINYVSETVLEENVYLIGDRVIVPAPLSTSAGFVQLIHYTVLGFTLFFEPAFDPERFLEILVREKITAFAGAPVFFEQVARTKGFAEADLSSIRVATCGGATVTRALQDQWLTKDIVIRQIYGQTECGGNATIMPADLARQYPEKCGRGGIFTELRIVDGNGNRLPAGQEGQIIVRGPGRMLGYWNNPKATAETIRDGWIYTGDIGVLDEDGLLTFVDRMKDIIISGGLNISAAEVERAISEYPGIDEVVVISAQDQKFGETPMAVVHGTSDISVEQLIAHCNERLADYKVPRYVAVEKDPLPRLATGKLSKPALRVKYKEASSSLPRVR